MTASTAEWIPAVALVGDHLRHRWCARELVASSAVELRGVVSERQPPPPQGATAAEDALVVDHFRLRGRAEERFFGASPAWEDLGIPILAASRGESNAPRVVKWVLSHSPDYLLLYGCGIIRAPLLDLFPGRIVNLHLGLSPYYRGHATNFWPLVNGEPECVGATVHLATSAVDAGPILRQVRPVMASDDGSHDIGCKALAAGVNALLAALPRYARGELEPVSQPSGGRVYRHADFDAVPGPAIAELRRRFAAGMIPDYLSRKPERDARFPIVE